MNIKKKNELHSLSISAIMTPKDGVTKTHKRFCFWKPLGSERVYESQKLLKSTETHFHPAFSSFLAKLSLKKVFLVRYEILGLVVNTLITDDKYSGHNRENLPLLFQMQLSKIILLHFYCIFRIDIRFWTIWKKFDLAT